MSGLAAEAVPGVAEPGAPGAPADVVIVADTVTAIGEKVTAVSTAAAEREEMPLPTDIHTIFLGGLFLLACLTAMYVASEIVLPIVLATVLKPLLQPVVSALDRLRVPRVLGALAALLLLIGVFAGLLTALTGPAVNWAGKLPDALPRFEREMRVLGRPLHAFQRALGEIERQAAGAPEATHPKPPAAAAKAPQASLARATAAPAAVQAAAPVQKAAAPAPSAVSAHVTALLETIFSGTRATIAGAFTTLLVLFYLLVSGDTFLRRLVEILPSFGEKRLAVEISLKIEHDISSYLVTITLINAVVGLATGCVMWICGVGDPLLWGVSAFVLNYIPILGPLFGVALFAVVGVLSKGAFLAALLPAGLYLLIHLLEGETITPMILARRFTINPVVVVVSLVFWYWMWGVPGAVLSVPMLAVAKIICDDVPQLRAFGHFLEG